MIKNVSKYIVFIILASLVLSSCKVTQKYQPPLVHTDSLYRDLSTTDTNTIATLHWTEIFTDTNLQKLIAEGIANNLNLQIAYTHIQQSQAFYLQSRAAFLPALNANAGVTESKFSKTQALGLNSATQYQIGISTSWIADIWGQLSSSKRANLASLLQSEAAARAVQTNLVASIANFYYSLLALDQQLAITEQTVKKLGLYCTDHAGIERGINSY